MPIEIGLKALSGARQFDIRLDPAELGRVDVAGIGEKTAATLLGRFGDIAGIVAASVLLVAFGLVYLVRFSPAFVVSSVSVDGWESPVVFPGAAGSFESVVPAAAVPKQ